MTMDTMTIASRCPIAHAFDPFAYEFLINPYAVWARLRQESPVFYAPDLDHYLVTRYAEIDEVYRDQENFSAANASAPMSPLTAEAAQVLRNGFPRKPTLNNSDPPRHGPMRKAVASCMGARRWSKLRPAVRAYAHQLVEAFVEKAEADLVAELAFPLPAYAGFRLLGFPETDTDLLKSWCGERLLLTYGRLEPNAQVSVAKNLVEFWQYVVQFVDLRIREPADDLASDLLEYARQYPDLLNFEDIHNIIYSISLAGHETTTNAISNATFALLRNPEQWDKLCKDPSLLDNAVEELLRFESPVIGKRRLAKRDVRIGDVLVPAGANILLLIGAAHRDAQRFLDPDRLDLSRSNARDHVAFGGPWHYCLGAPLARFEMRTVLQLLTQMAPNMRLVPGRQMNFLPTIAQRGPESIWIEPRPTSSGP